jgi:hypothetical protein
MLYLSQLVSQEFQAISHITNSSEEEIMFTRPVRRIVLAVFTALLLLSFSVPALANPPDHEEEWELITVDEPLFDCGDFLIMENSRFTGHSTLFYNRDGDFIRAQSYITFSGRLSNSITGETVIDTPDPQIYVYYPEEGYVDLHGLVLSINIPGTGVVGLDAGTISYTIDGDVTFQSGPHHLIQDGFYVDYTVVCDALR